MYRQLDFISFSCFTGVKNNTDGEWPDIFSGQQSDRRLDGHKANMENTNAIGIFSRVPSWVEVFLKYNTGTPSSAAIDASSLSDPT